MKTLTMLLVLCTSALGQPPGFKIPESGTDLVHQCQSYDRNVTPKGAGDIAIEMQSLGYGMGYCFGVINTTAELLQIHGDIRLPDGGEISFEQIKKIVTNYLDAHPEEWQKPASVVVTKALKQAWGTTAAK